MINVEKCEEEGCPLCQARGAPLCHIHTVAWPALGPMKAANNDMASGLYAYAWRSFQHFGMVPTTISDGQSATALGGCPHPVRLGTGPMSIPIGMTKERLKEHAGAYIIGAIWDGSEDGRFSGRSPLVVGGGQLQADGSLVDTYGVFLDGDIVKGPPLIAAPQGQNAPASEQLLAYALCYPTDEPLWPHVGFLDADKGADLVELPSLSGDEYALLEDFGMDGTAEADAPHQSLLWDACRHSAGWGFVDVKVVGKGGGRAVVGAVPALDWNGDPGSVMEFFADDGGRGVWVPLVTRLGSTEAHSAIRTPIQIVADLRSQDVPLLALAANPAKWGHVLLARLPALITAMAGHTSHHIAAVQLCRTIVALFQGGMIEPKMHASPEVYFFGIENDEGVPLFKGVDADIFEGHPSVVPRVMARFGALAAASCEYEGAGGVMIWRDIAARWGVVHCGLPVQALVDTARGGILLQRIRPQWLTETSEGSTEALHKAASLFEFLGATPRPRNPIFS